MYTIVAQLDEIPEGSLLGVEAEGQEIVLANVDGNIYALQGRCGHMNAPLADGKLVGSTLICDLHFAQFDVTTGEKIKDPVLGGGPEMQEFMGLMDQLSDQAKAGLGRTMELQQKVKTYNLKVFPVQVDGNDVQVDI